MEVQFPLPLALRWGGSQDDCWPIRGATVGPFSVYGDHASTSPTAMTQTWLLTTPRSDCVTGQTVGGIPPRYIPPTARKSPTSSAVT